MVSILECHSGDRGWIPRRVVFIYLFIYLLVLETGWCSGQRAGLIIQRSEVRILVQSCFLYLGIEKTSLPHYQSWHGSFWTSYGVSIQHTLRHDGRGPFGLRQNGLHHQTTGGSSRLVRGTPKKDLLLLRILARWLQTHEIPRHSVSRGHSRFGTITRLVSQRGIVGLGGSDGTRRKRQTLKGIDLKTEFRLL